MAATLYLKITTVPLSVSNSRLKRAIAAILPTYWSPKTNWISTVVLARCQRRIAPASSGGAGGFARASGLGAVALGAIGFPGVTVLM
jgi:hypothetical protein